MKRILAFILLFSFQCVVSQNIDTISVNFENKTIEEVLYTIEKDTDYKFFFIKDWLPNKRITGTYNNEPISKVLTELFAGTTINFYIRRI